MKPLFLRVPEHPRRKVVRQLFLRPRWHPVQGRARAPARLHDAGARERLGICSRLLQGSTVPRRHHCDSGSSPLHVSHCRSGLQTTPRLSKPSIRRRQTPRTHSSASTGRVHTRRRSTRGLHRAQSSTCSTQLQPLRQLPHCFSQWCFASTCGDSVCRYWGRLMHCVGLPVLSASRS